MHNFSGKLGPSNFTMDSLPNLADKKATFFSKDRTCFEKERTDKPRPPPQQTNQTTNQPRKKETNQPTNQPRKKETNKPTNLLLPFPPKKTCNFYALHTCASTIIKDTIHHPSTSPCHRHGWPQKLHQRLGSAPHPCKARRWQSATTQPVGFNHQKSGGGFQPSEKHPENRWFQPWWKGLKIRWFVWRIGVFSQTFWWFVV